MTARVAFSMASAVLKSVRLFDRSVVRSFRSDQNSRTLEQPNCRTFLVVQLSST
jgi:hypothetical protein